MRTKTSVLVLGTLALALGCGPRKVGEEEGSDETAVDESAKKAGRAEEQRVKRVVLGLETAEVPELVEALGDSDRRVRRAALIELGEKKPSDEKVIKKMIPLLADHWGPTRIAAVEALEEIGAPAVRPLIECLHTDSYLGNMRFMSGKKQVSLRHKAKDALGEIGAPAVRPLIEALDSEDLSTRRNASGALGRMGKTALPALERLLRAADDENPMIRLNAVGDLAKISPLDERVIAAVEKAEKDENKKVRKGAEYAAGLIEKARARSPESKGEAEGADEEPAEPAAKKPAEEKEKK
ncbi:MAG: HEAT repeat domain-containing protein [Polyangia bacterium]